VSLVAGSRENKPARATDRTVELGLLERGGGVVSALRVGQVATLKRVLSQEDFNRFAALSGDDNPIHVDPEFSARTRFGRTVSHGMLLYGIICGALSTHFPGAVQLQQGLMFPTPAFAGEEITVRLEVVAVRQEERQARVRTVVSKATGDVVCQGQTVVRWPGR